MTTAYAEPVGVRVPELEPGATCDATASGSEMAVVRMANDFGDVLDFCAHHSREHSPALVMSGFCIKQDNSEILSQNYRGEAGE